MSNVLYKAAQIIDAVWAKVKANPVLTSYVVTALVGLGARYGLDMEPEVVAAILGLTATAAAVTARAKVTPV